MKQFRFCWLDGTSNTIKGESAEHCLVKQGWLSGSKDAEGNYRNRALDGKKTSYDNTGKPLPVVYLNYYEEK